MVKDIQKRTMVHGAVVEYVSQKPIPQQNNSNRKSVRMCRLFNYNILLFTFFRLHYYYYFATQSCVNVFVDWIHLLHSISHIFFSFLFSSSSCVLSCVQSSHATTTGAPSLPRERAHTQIWEIVLMIEYMTNDGDAEDDTIYALLIHRSHHHLTCAKNDWVKFMMDLLFLLIWDKTTQHHIIISFTIL